MRIVETMEKVQNHNIEWHRHAFRTTRAKSQSLVNDTLAVPETSLLSFKRAFSPHLENAASLYNLQMSRFLQPDAEPGLRGLSLKVLGVKGKRLQV